MIDNSRHNNAINPQKQELVQLLLRKRGIEVGQANTSTPGAKSDPRILSYGQERLWFLNQWEPGSSLYNIPVAIHLVGRLDATALQRSIEEIIRRHEALRTTFKEVEGQVLRFVAPFSPLRMPVVSVRAYGERERSAEMQALIRQEARRPFDLRRAPLLRASLLRLDDEEHVLLLTMHHIAFDGWSLGVLFRDLSIIYEAFLTETSSPLPALPMQYAEYAARQRQWLEGEALASQLAYWKQQLAGAPAVLKLPSDWPRPVMLSYRGATERIELSADLTERVKALSRRDRVTLFTTLLAVFKVLLHRYTYSDDIVVGSPVAARNRTEIEGMIGFFVNNLVLRTDLSGNPTFRELLKRVWNVAIRAYAHQDLPFEKLVQELQPERSLSHSPLFQVMFVLQTAPMEAPQLEGLTARCLAPEIDTSKFDLTLDLGEESGSLRGLLHYSTDLFDQTTIGRMIGHYQTLLKAVVSDPEQRLCELPMLTDVERTQLLLRWNDTDREYPKEVGIHELFEAQVKKTPDAVAVVFEKEALTYAELNRRANQLAHYLRKVGVRREVLVGICVERSVEMVIGLLGILKAGGAYVPLDPSYPQDRLRAVLGDARVEVVLTENHLASSLPASEAHLVYLDKTTALLGQESDGDLEGGTRGEDRAYVIYTSGSTGKPKGVEIPHRAVVNFLSSMGEQPGMTARDILLAVTTISFDIAGLELYLPLTTGACVVIASREMAADGSRLSGYIDEISATVMQATPATWQMLLSAGWQGRKQLKILCGGEALSSELARELLERADSVWNLYGPTESTIWSTRWRVETEQCWTPIGRPIANTKIYVLDGQLQPVPIGVAGELYIGGAGLAHGYLNRPELTAEKFISNPFSDEPGARLYKTGDLVRYRADGNVEYLGRLDHQVKIRGFRIEPGEIESVLLQHPAIAETVVVAHEEALGDKRLVAYIVSQQTALPAVQELRTYLKEKLPDYMIPSAFVTLDSLPLTPNGKIDRNALPAPNTAQLKFASTYTGPSTKTEEILTAIWSKMLGHHRIGVCENFFELGGHSLMAAHLFAQIERKLGAKLPIAILFQAPTIRELARKIEQGAWKSSWNSLVPIQTEGSRPPLFLIHGAEGNVLLYRKLAEKLGRRQPVYGLQSRGLDGIQPMERHFESMAAKYQEEIQSVQRTGPYYLGGYCLGGTIALEVAQRLRRAGDSVALLAMFESYNVQNTPPGSALLKTFHRGQNIYFHVRNLLLSGSGGASKFLGEKFKVELARFNVHCKICFARLVNSRQLNYRHLQVKFVNHQAQETYQPAPYDGKILLFRPKAHYRGFDDQYFGWGTVAMQGVQIMEMPNYPKGSLNEPFVDILASKLEAEISKTLPNSERYDGSISFARPSDKLRGENSSSYVEEMVKG